MTRARFMAAAVVVCAVAALPAGARAQSLVDGDWELTIESPQGSRTVATSLKQDGDKLTGVFKSPAGELPLAGSLTGADVKLTFTINLGGTPLDVVMTGKMDGETMSGQADFGGMAQGTFSARRPAATAAAVPVAAAAATAPAGTAPATSAPADTAPATTAPDVDAAAAPSSAALAASLAGTWDVTLKTGAGDFALTATLTEDAGKVGGTFQTQMGEMAVSGTHDGRALKLSMIAKTPQGDIPVSLTGDVDGDAISNGKAEFGGMGQGEWTARRKQ